MRLKRKAGTAAIVAIFALAPATSAWSGALFGSLQGPDSVRPGARVAYWARGLPSFRKVSLTIQPSMCVGGNGCYVGVRGSWKSNSTGTVRLKFRFPRHSSRDDQWYVKQRGPEGTDLWRRTSS